jgi:hypothetical protein
MNKKIIFFLVSLLLFSILLIDYSYMQEKEKEGEVFTFLTVNDYIKLSDVEKLLYTLGLVDMYSYLTKHLDPKYYLDFRGKIEPMNAGQIQAIFDKYIEEHPEKWHFAAAAIFDEAVISMVNDL